MEAQVEKVGDLAVVRLHGGLDISSEHGLHQAVGALERAGSRAINIDLAGVDFIDSRGLSTLLTIHREWSLRGRTVKFLGPLHPAVQRVLDVSGVHDELAFVQPPPHAEGPAPTSA